MKLFPQLVVTGCRMLTLWLKSLFMEPKKVDEDPMREYIVTNRAPFGSIRGLGSVRGGWSVFSLIFPLTGRFFLVMKEGGKMLGSLLITLFVFVPVVVLSKLLAHSRKAEMQPVRIVSTHGRRARRRS
jgi:hypothetical protein